MNLLKDYLASRVISQGKVLDNYSRVYFRTTENLDRLDSMADFKGKDVLSVLSSSDQLFSVNLLGARTDTYDTNVLTLYYHYLRVWSVLYKDELYPYLLRNNSYRWLALLLNNVVPKSKEEENALKFWKSHLNERTDFSKLFYEDSNEGRTSLTVSKVKRVVEKSPNFREINLFIPNEAKKKYDIVLASNIIEWARGDIDKIRVVRDNLGDFLKPKGIIICSSLIHRDREEIEEEKELFDEEFTYNNYGNDVGYTYTKK